MRVERLNFFGVKMINNTTGADRILGSRMLHVRTARVPPEIQAELAEAADEISFSLADLRDELHVWTFENAALIDATYQRLFARPRDRASEISAPLRVFAEIAGDEALSDGLRRALEAHESVSGAKKSVNPVDVVKKAFRILVAEGFRKISPTHVALEMKSMMQQMPPATRGGSGGEKTGQCAAAWVGRQLRAIGCVDVNAPCAREHLFGKSLRVYPVSKNALAEVLDENNSDSCSGSRLPVREATDFCAGCQECRYRTLACPIMTSRLKFERKSRKRA